MVAAPRHLKFVPQASARAGCRAVGDELTYRQEQPPFSCQLRPHGRSIRNADRSCAVAPAADHRGRFLFIGAMRRAALRTGRLFLNCPVECPRYHPLTAPTNATSAVAVFVSKNALTGSSNDNLVFMRFI